MKISNLFALIVACHFIGINSMDRSSGDSRASTATSGSEYSSGYNSDSGDPDAQDQVDNLRSSGRSTESPLARRRAASSGAHQFSLHPVRQLSLGKLPRVQSLTQSPSIHSGSNRSSHSGTPDFVRQLCDSARSSNSSARTQDSTPRDNNQEADILFSSDYDLQDALIKLLKTEQAICRLATKKLSDNQIIEALQPNSSIYLPIKNFPKNQKTQKLFASSINLYRLDRQKFSNTIGIISFILSEKPATIGIMGSFIPCDGKITNDHISDSTNISEESLTIFYAPEQVQKVSDQINYLHDNSIYIEPQSTTAVLAAAAAALGGEEYNG